MTRRLAPFVCGVFMLAASAGAQVGHLPSRSPYRDLEYTQELTLMVGPYAAARDPAGAAPRSGALVGAHYEWRAGGPAYLIGDLSYISSSRQMINPFGVGPARDLGTATRPLYAGNVGLGMSLTGAKSWHNLVPMASAGLGFVSDLRTKADSGGFKFGTRFALNVGTGIRWIPGGRWSYRLDLTDRLYTISYPESFYFIPTGGKAVVGSGQPRSFWLNNPSLTLGISRLY